MIPRIIHYCWFGRGEMSGLMKRCLKSWKKYCPDWEIICWNEDNFDVNSTLWTKQAYEAKKYAFVSDYVRLKALLDYGGVYLDTDVELVKGLDPLLVHDAFSGFESETVVQSGVIGAVPGQQVVRDWLAWYDNQEYIVNGKPVMVPNVSFVTSNLQLRGLIMDDSFQCVDGMAIYPQTWFCPLSPVSIEKRITGNTHAIHYFASTWRSVKAKKDFARVKRHQTKWYRTWVWVRYLPNRLIRRIFGDNVIDQLKNTLKK